MRSGCVGCAGTIRTCGVVTGIVGDAGDEMRAAGRFARDEAIRLWPIAFRSLSRMPESLYLVTGVCYQTANRILYPAGVLVSMARGYNQSVFFWGTYGLGGWPQREECAKVGGASGAQRR